MKLPKGSKSARRRAAWKARQAAEVRVDVETTSKPPTATVTRAPFLEGDRTALIELHFDSTVMAPTKQPPPPAPHVLSRTRFTGLSLLAGAMLVSDRAEPPPPLATKKEEE